MAKKNFFEMLGLEFDPPDNVKKIRAAYDSWKKKLTIEQNTTVDPLRLNEIREELQMDEYISRTIDNPRFRQQAAESLKQQRVEELRKYIGIQRGETQGTLQVNQTQIRQIKDKLRLSPATIEATYKEQGFEIKPAKTAQKILATLNATFLPDSIMEELRKNFEAFRQVPDKKNFPWSSAVHNLYELAFYLENQIEKSADFYRRHSTEELREIFRDAAKKYSSPVPEWQAIKSLLNIAQSQVFNTDDSHYKYDHSLKIESLANLFADIKAAPEVFKRDSYFADNCIKRIRKKFPNFLDYELSSALYNKAAGLLKNPYESTDAVDENSFCVTCANCGAFENFRTREEAERAVCKICGDNFFIECPKCGKKIPASAKYCTACNFSFTELKNFSKNIEQIDEMLKLIKRARNVDETVNLVSARIVELLAETRRLKPDSYEVKNIEVRINETAAELKKREIFSWAEKKLPSLSISPEKAVSDCMEILRKIKDYKPALDRLKLIAPKTSPVIVATLKENYSPAKSSSISKISVKAKSSSVKNIDTNLICNVSWQAPNDLGLTYTLVRKINGVPKTYRDGEILIENTDRLEFTDFDVKPGVIYGYAIFSTRLGTISAPKTATVVHYSDLDEKKLIAKNKDGACKFTWELPSENCLGIRILRSDSAGKSVVVADCVQSPFVDSSVKNRMQYQYRLQCVYFDAEDTINNNEKYFSRQSYDKNLRGVWNIDRNYKYSSGLTVTLTPEKLPKTLKNLNCTVKGGRAIFSWKSTGDFSVWFKEVIKEAAQIEEKLFELNTVDELLGSGVVYKKAESSDETCDFPLSNETVKIAVVSATREFGLVNEIITCANVEPCEIDAGKTQIDAGGLKLVLKSVPENLYQIHYKINTKNADELYATIETAKARQMNRIYATKYVQDTFILQPHLPPKEIYITVIGEYKFSDGTAAYCAPSTLTLDNRPKEIISYWLEWGTSGFFKKEIHAKDCKLIIESNARPTPEMKLICRLDGRMNIEAGDSILLGTVNESAQGYTNGRFETDLPNDNWEKVSTGTVVKLRISKKEDEKRFELKASRPDSLIVPKK